MDKKGIICLVVILLGTISAITGFAAEATRVKRSQVHLDAFGECTYPKSPSHVLGLTSALMLLIGKMILNFSTGCLCCKRRTALTLLLKAAAFQAQHKEATVMNGWEYCSLVRPGLFACGAVLAVISLVFGILYYLTLNSKGKEDAKAPVPTQGDITMAQPQFPLENPDSVNEDAKDKQQFS
ncbi:hypothetical protein ERO13_D08G243901v2 [Gossypium hirsutum]|uniref:Uncharacterized protein n=3 Tax=Gossypium TaxID=3633 RepID=A0A0D2RAW5_GOSRA|nr:hypothetical protein ERO13_D08G243901v2 [Gossypium hirsutum]KJB26781.1 hypothetical protein B456_004G259800 [Gossypium raimondii]TYG59168.1 hypothetical protein ES288_D08G280600v1 [Gossypium darwinii]TYI71106.1 hypothetical protein E1A91_D08G271300v1 [Gossypium mustelinum]